MSKEIKGDHKHLTLSPLHAFTRAWVFSIINSSVTFEVEQLVLMRYYKCTRT